MLNLKDSIIDYISNEYPDLSKTKKSLIGHLALKKIFSEKYYKDTYYSSSVVLMKNNMSYIATNQCDISPRKINRGLYSLYEDYNNHELLNNVKKYLLAPEVYSRLTKFISIIKQNSNDFNLYTDKLIEAHKGDNEFLSTIYSFNFIFKDFDKLLNKNVQKILNDKGIDKIESKICKKNISFPKLDINDDKNLLLSLNQEWLSNESFITSSLLEAKKSFINITEYYNKYEGNINNIINKIKEERPFIFKEILLEDITFSYFETKACKDEIYSKRFNLENDLAINPKILSKHNIKLSDIYNIPENFEDPYSYKNDVFNYILNKSNDLSNGINNNFYGLTFLERNILESNEHNNSYILATHNNENIGFFSFRSSKYDAKSIFKGIEYVCIKDNFRSIGLVEILYDKAINILNDNGNILTNSCYTPQGEVKLPKLKDRMRNKYPEFLLIDKECGDTSFLSKNEKILLDFKTHFNKNFIDKIKYYEQQNSINITNKADEIKEFYKKNIKYINENIIDFTEKDGTYNHIDKRISFDNKIFLEIDNIILGAEQNKKLKY